MDFITRLGCAAALFLGVAEFASASESGTFSALMSSTYEFTTVEVAGTHVTAGSVHGIFTVTASSGAPFATGQHSAAVCVAYVKQSATGVDLEAPCVITDPSGDALHLVLRRTEGTVGIGGGGEGSSQVLGGTGAYSGMVGTCSYEATYIGDRHVVGPADCEWQRP